MGEQEHVFTFDARISTAVWPGDGMFCVRLSAPKWMPDQMTLVGRDDRMHELRLYKYGMFEGLR